VRHPSGTGARSGAGGRTGVAGGGAHGAFAWGVLDRLLEQGPQIDAICGVSCGALIGVMLACHNVLAAERAALPEDGALTIYDADAALVDLPISTKFNDEEEFLSLLFNAGRVAAAARGLPGSVTSGWRDSAAPQIKVTAS
jgi:predicted acylesterase/phospholipase RssA